MLSTIILEGPDGAGKTTLRNRLLNDLGVEAGPRASTSLGGPVPDLLNWVEEDMGSWPMSDTVRVYDRYPLISEQVYGNIVRDAPRYPFGSAVGTRHMTQFRKDALVIFCLPPRETVMANVAADTEGQMPGVAENIGDIYTAYEALANGWGLGGIRYDYTLLNSDAEMDKFIMSVAMVVTLGLLYDIVENS